MKIYTTEEIFKAVRDYVDNEYITDYELHRYIDHATAEAYLNNKTHDFKNIMQITYDYYNDPNFPALERLLDSVLETDDDTDELNFEPEEEFEI